MTRPDANGERVLAFTGKVRNLARIAELTNAVIEIAASGAWRDYQTATGREHWREAELDYFLIACDMHYDDVSRVLAWNARAEELAPMMDKDANSTRRRALEQAAAQWRSPTGEGLIDRAKRLGWLRNTGAMRASPVPERARAKAKHGMTLEQHARQSRARRLPARRRRELDQIAAGLRAQLTDHQELRYVIEQLAHDGPDRPASDPAGA